MSDLEKAILDLVPTELQPWLFLGIPILVAVLGSSVLTQLVVNWIQGSRSKKANQRQDADDALKALRKFRQIALVEGNKPAGSIPSADIDAEIAVLGSRLVISTAALGKESTTDKAEAYVSLAERFASHDELLSAESEKKAFRELLKLLASRKKKRA